MPLSGVEELLASFKAMAVRADTAGRQVVIRSQIVFEAAAKAEFVAAHKRGTKTPAMPGEAPATVTGTLRRGIVSDAPKVVGLGTWSGSVFPTTVYARIQELGGVTGRNGSVRLPPRPYMAPALAKVQSALSRIHTEEFNRVIGA